MIRATELSGRAVVDIDGAEKVGAIDKIILDPDGRRIAGFVVTRPGSGFPGTKAQVLIPSSAVHAIGPDAVTIRQSVVAGTDIGLDRGDGRIVGYQLSDHTPGAKFEEMFGKDKKHRDAPYLPADAKIRTGRDLIVASEDAVNYDWQDEDAPAPAGTPISKWGYASPPSPIAPPTVSSIEPPVLSGVEPPVSRVEPPTADWVRNVEDEVRPRARGVPKDIDGIDTGRETNPRVR